MSQWAEIRHMYLTDHVPKKQIARRLGVDVKTVDRDAILATAKERGCYLSDDMVMVCGTRFYLV